MVFGKNIERDGYNPGKPGYTMDGPPYGFQLELSWVGSRILKPFLLRSAFKTAGLRTD